MSLSKTLHPLPGTGSTQEIPVISGKIVDRGAKNRLGKTNRHL